MKVVSIFSLSCLQESELKYSIFFSCNFTSKLNSYWIDSDPKTRLYEELSTVWLISTFKWVMFYVSHSVYQGYLPANAERRESVLQRKRQEYFGFIQQYYDSRNDEHHQDTYRQVHAYTRAHTSRMPIAFWIPQLEGQNEWKSPESVLFPITRASSCCQCISSAWI